ncbi:zinc ribbon domain-containing protein [Halosolutus gelatinilyticus]|uniref:zinc ribbon domain-containing protein n=1 Tax=Halosolutus gelatinilyticus TaxID=2931975 RepID=UPI001FF24E76|nr:zinc ribbon domain-containing protein [Halosolutus gelatinilyticus]
MVAITAVGAYAPRFRITAEAFREAWGQFQAPGVNEKAVPGADEDALTMASEAAVRALDAAGLEGEAITWLGFGTSNPPLEEGDLTARLGAMLAVPDDAPRQVFAGSTRAGTRALRAGTDAIAAEGGRGLIVAADAPRGDPDDAIDHAAGAGAAAFVVAPEGPAEIVDRAEYAAPYPGTRFRQYGARSTEGLEITQYDRQAFTETIAGAVGGLETDPEPDAAAIQAPDGKLPYRAAGAAGVGADEIRACATVHDLGDLGAASVPVSLTRALAEGCASILAVSHGSGAGADAFVLDATADVPTSTALDRGGEDDAALSYAEYLRQRGVVTSGPPSGGGAYVSVPSWRRSLPQRYRLVAGRCVECGALSFPPEGACGECGALADYDPIELAGEGTIEAVTTISQGGAPPEFAEQQAQAGDYAAAIVALGATDEDESAGGERDAVSVPAMGTDAAPETFAVGDRVETTIRRIYTQEGVTRYGFKIRPAGD